MVASWSATTGCPSNAAACVTWATANIPAIPTACVATFYLNPTLATSCTACSGNCAQCTTASNCLTCNNGYYLASAVCVSCGTGLSCATCSTVTSCTACAQPNTNAAGVCGSAANKFFVAGATAGAAAAGGAITAGVCTLTDGNNLGWCAAGATGATYSAANNAAITVTGASAVTNCLVYVSTGGATYSCLQCMNGYAPSVTAGTLSINTCASTNPAYVPYCNIYSVSTTAATYACIGCS